MTSALHRLMLTLRTARHLRPGQLAYRIIRSAQPVRPPAVIPVTFAESAPALRERLVAWGPGNTEARLRNAEAITDHRFRFLNTELRLDSIDWTRRYGSHLWSYQLQYFDYALDLAWACRSTGDERYARTAAALAENWIAQTACGGVDAWSPYTTSLRTINWIAAALLLEHVWDTRTTRTVAASVHQQLRFLERRLERQHLGNHFQKNLYALTVGSLAFDDVHARRWRNSRVPTLWSEARTQILDDGGHYERSPMYHAIALDDFLRAIGLCDACGVNVPADVRARVRRMADAGALFHDEDGSLALFNDSANGVAPRWDDLAALVTFVLGRPPAATLDGAWSLPLTGYYGFNDGATGERFIIDCGPPSVDFQFAHAHCDLLSFQLHLAGVPFIVDSGVAGYAGHPLREYVRSTRAHNTIAVDGLEQSEVWGTFRMARRARAGTATQTGAEFRGSYRPYHDACVHERVVSRSQPGRWEVADRVRGAEGRQVTSWLHVHPEWECEQVEEGEVLARRGEQAVRVEVTGGGRLEMVRGALTPPQGWYCPEFGLSHAAVALTLDIPQYQGSEFGWQICDLTLGAMARDGAQSSTRWEQN